MYRGKIISSTIIPPRVGDTVYALSDCDDWFSIKIIQVYSDGSVAAKVVPSNLERYRNCLNNPDHAGNWIKKIKYYHNDPNDIEFHKR